MTFLCSLYVILEELSNSIPVLIQLLPKFWQMMHWWHNFVICIDLAVNFCSVSFFFLLAWYLFLFHLLLIPSYPFCFCYSNFQTKSYFIYKQKWSTTPTQPYTFPNRRRCCCRRTHPKTSFFLLGIYYIPFPPRFVWPSPVVQILIPSLASYRWKNSVNFFLGTARTPFLVPKMELIGS